jgi:hypothetical protein
MIDAEKILLINCSYPNYNLGLEKMKVFFGPRARESRSLDLFNQDCDGVILSAIFSWHVPFAIRQAQAAINMGKKVIIGGGGTYQLRHWIQKETGLTPYFKPHADLERVDAQFKMVYFTRGCIEHCFFCIVPKIEGHAISINPVSRPARVLLDNNLSEIPRQYQEHIVEKYLSAGTKSVDANSGFEPKGITPEMVELFDKLPLRWWRVGFDELAEESQFIESIRVIKAHSKKPIRVYTMIGHEPIEACRYRCEKVIAMGCEPVPQPYIELRAKTKTPTVMHDWTDQSLRDFARFFYMPGLWRKLKLEDYSPRIGKHPFF